jgi:hypothetical protein
MLIKTSKAQVPGTLAGPRTPEVAVDDPIETRRMEAEKAEAALHALQARAGWFSALSYHHYADLPAVLDDAKVTDFECFADPSGSTAVFAFLFEGRAWLVFRGTNDFNDLARDVSALPMWHLGFRLCFREIVEDLRRWTDGITAKGHHFCVAGHSLGGALALLAAEDMAKAGRPIEMVCTFGCPRVFAPWQAGAYDNLSANLPGHPDRRLEQVTYRFVDSYEFISHVPPALMGFKHVGRGVECGAIPSLPTPEVQGRREDLAAAYRKAMEVPVIGPWLLVPPILAKGAYRAIRTPAAHKSALYARHVDPMEIWKIALDAPCSTLSKGRFQLRSTIALLCLAALVLAIVGAALFLLWKLAVLIWGVPWGSLGAPIILALATFLYQYSEKRRERRESRILLTGPYSRFLRPGLADPPIGP